MSDLDGSAAPDHHGSLWRGRFFALATASQATRAGLEPWAFSEDPSSETSEQMWSIGVGRKDSVRLFRPSGGGVDVHREWLRARGRKHEPQGMADSDESGFIPGITFPFSPPARGAARRAKETSEENHAEQDLGRLETRALRGHRGGGELAPL